MDETDWKYTVTTIHEDVLRIEKDFLRHDSHLDALDARVNHIEQKSFLKDLGERYDLVPEELAYLKVMDQKTAEDVARLIGQARGLARLDAEMSSYVIPAPSASPSQYSSWQDHFVPLLLGIAAGAWIMMIAFILIFG